MEGNLTYKEKLIKFTLSEAEANVLYDICQHVAGEKVAYDICEFLESLEILGTGRDADESKLRRGQTFELRFLPAEEA